MDLEKAVKAKKVEKTESEIVDDIIDKLRMESYVPCLLSTREREVALKWMENAKVLISCNESDREVKITWV